MASGRKKSTKPKTAAPSKPKETPRSNVKRKPKPEASSATWSLASYRLPLDTVPPAASVERAQLETVLDQEWSCSIAEARKDDEIDLELVDVVDPKGKTRFQLYLWPFGSGLAFAAGTTDEVAEIIQHGLAPTTDDLEVAPAIRAAIEADAKRLGLREARVPSVVPRAPAEMNLASASFDEAIAKAEERLAREPRPYFSEVTQYFVPWLTTLYRHPREPRPYPKRLLEELTPLQRMMLERFVAWDTVPPLSSQGLFDTRAQFARYFGQGLAGPTDTIITLDGREVPAWWAISSAAAGHAKPASVLAALTQLAPDQRRAIVLEVARGDAYDLVRAQRTDRKDREGPFRRTYWTTLFQLLADLTHSLGAGARETADALLADLPSYQFGGKVDPHPRTPRAVLALLVLVNIAAPFDAAIDPVIRELGAYFMRDEIFIDKKQLARILAAVPADRRASIAADAQLRLFL